MLPTVRGTQRHCPTLSSGLTEPINVSSAAYGPAHTPSSKSAFVHRGRRYSREYGVQHLAGAFGQVGAVHKGIGPFASARKRSRMQQRRADSPQRRMSRPALGRVVLRRDVGRRGCDVPRLRRVQR